MKYHIAVGLFVVLAVVAVVSSAEPLPEWPEPREEYRGDSKWAIFNNRIDHIKNTTEIAQQRIDAAISTLVWSPNDFDTRFYINRPTTRVVQTRISDDHRHFYIEVFEPITIHVTDGDTSLTLYLGGTP